MGWGLHITAALDGVPLEDRCRGWETGQCPGGESEEQICELCYYKFNASTSDELEKAQQQQTHTPLAADDVMCHDVQTMRIHAEVVDEQGTSQCQRFAADK
jgi:hypothetical protein